MTLHQPRGGQPRDRSAHVPVTSNHPTLNAARPGRSGQNRTGETAARHEEPLGMPLRGASPRPWMTPVAPTEPISSAASPMTTGDPPPAPIFASVETAADAHPATAASLLPAPPEAVFTEDADGEFVVGPDFRLRSLTRAQNCFLFPDKVALNESIWTWLGGETRRRLYGAFKRLLGGESLVVWESRRPGEAGETCRFECTRRIIPQVLPDYRQNPP